MIKKTFILTMVASLALLTPLSLVAAIVDIVSDAQFNAHDIIGDEDLIDIFGMTESEVQAFLISKGGALASYTEVNPDTLQAETSAHIIWQAAQDAQVNPEIILTMLQKEQSLVEDSNPSEYQYKWATGYSKCDGCAGIEAYQGFRNQVRASAKRMRYFYDHPEEFTGYQAGKTSTTLDGFSITPANKATAGLYIYNPWRGGSRVDNRLIGANYNFYKIWKRFFKPTFDDRTLVRMRDTNEWLVIQSEKRRPFVDTSIIPQVFSSETMAFARVLPARKLTRYYPIGDVITLNDAFAGTLVGSKSENRSFAGSTNTMSISYKNLGVKAWEQESLRLVITDVAGAPSPLVSKGWPSTRGEFKPQEGQVPPGAMATFHVRFSFPKVVRGYDQLLTLEIQSRKTASAAEKTDFRVSSAAPSIFGDVRLPEGGSPQTNPSPAAPSESTTTPTPITYPLTVSGTRTSLILVAESPLQGAIVEESIPSTLKPGERVQATVKIKNTGTIPWKRMTVRLSAYGKNGTKQRSPLYHKSWRDQSRVALMKEQGAKPGEVATFIFTLQAPKKEENYTHRFQWTLQDGSNKQFLGQPIRLEGIHPELIKETLVLKKKLVEVQ